MALDVMSRIKIERLLLFVPVSLEETKAHTEVQSEAVGNAPVILKVGLKQLVTVVIFDQVILLIPYLTIILWMLEEGFLTLKQKLVALAGLILLAAGMVEVVLRRNDARP